jgi:hypothetical protein
MIWYLGMDGLGGIDLENEEDENVRPLNEFSRVTPKHSPLAGPRRNRQVFRHLA